MHRALPLPRWPSAWITNGSESKARRPIDPVNLVGAKSRRSLSQARSRAIGRALFDHRRPSAPDVIQRLHTPSRRPRRRPRRRSAPHPPPSRLRRPPPSAAQERGLDDCAGRTGRHDRHVHAEQLLVRGHPVALAISHVGSPGSSRVVALARRDRPANPRYRFSHGTQWCNTFTAGEGRLVATAPPAHHQTSRRSDGRISPGSALGSAGPYGHWPLFTQPAAGVALTVGAANDVATVTAGGSKVAVAPMLMSVGSTFMAGTVGDA